MFLGGGESFLGRWIKFLGRWIMFFWEVDNFFLGRWIKLKFCEDANNIFGGGG